MTPKKESYNLRNRTVVTESNTPDLDSTIPFETSFDTSDILEEEGIMGENVPEAVSQQESEALLEQIKQLQVSQQTIHLHTHSRQIYQYMKGYCLTFVHNQA